MNCSEIDIQQADYLKFKALQKIEIGPKFSKENESIKSLLVTSQKYGFMIAATEREIKYFQPLTLSSNANEENAIHVEFPISSLNLSCDELTLAVVSRNKVYFLDIVSIANGRRTNLNENMIQLCSENHFLLSFRWSPSDANTFLFLTSDGIVSTYSLTTNAPSLVVKDPNISDIDWHPNQNEIVTISRNAKICIHSQKNGTWQSKFLPNIPELSEEQPEGHFIRWLDDNILFAGFKLASDNFVTVTVLTRLNDEWTSQKQLNDVQQENFNFLLVYLKEWNLLLWTTTASEVISVLERSESDTKWIELSLDDDSRPDIPNDTHIIGMAFNVISAKSISQRYKEESEQDQAITSLKLVLVLLTTDGTFVPYEVLSQNKKEQPSFVKQPLPLPSEHRLPRIQSQQPQQQPQPPSQQQSQTQTQTPSPLATQQSQPLSQSQQQSQSQSIPTINNTNKRDATLPSASGSNISGWNFSFGDSKETFGFGFSSLAEPNQTKTVSSTTSQIPKQIDTNFSSVNSKQTPPQAAKSQQIQSTQSTPQLQSQIKSEESNTQLQKNIPVQQQSKFQVISPSQKNSSSSMQLQTPQSIAQIDKSKSGGDYSQIQTQFKEELTKFSKVIQNIQILVQDTVELIRLIKNFKKSEAQKQLKFSEEGLLELSRIIDQLKERCVEAAKTLEEQQKEIDAIRLDLFELLVQKEEAQSSLQVIKDKTYSYLIDSRRLDPETLKMKKKLRFLMSSLKCGISQLEDHLNMLFEQKKRYDKTVATVLNNPQVPLLGRLYATIKHHILIIHQQQQRIKELNSMWHSFQTKAQRRGYSFSPLGVNTNATKKKKNFVMLTPPPFEYTSQTLLAKPYEDITDQSYDRYFGKHPLDERLQQVKEQVLKRIVSTGRLKVNSHVINNLNMTLRPSQPTSSPNVLNTTKLQTSESTTGITTTPEKLHPFDFKPQSTNETLSSPISKTSLQSSSQPLSQPQFVAPIESPSKPVSQIQIQSHIQPPKSKIVNDVNLQKVPLVADYSDESSESEDLSSFEKPSIELKSRPPSQSEKSDIGKLAKTLSKSQKELFNKQIQKEELEPKKQTENSSSESLSLSASEGSFKTQSEFSEEEEITASKSLANLGTASMSLHIHKQKENVVPKSSENSKQSKSSTTLNNFSFKQETPFFSINNNSDTNNINVNKNTNNNLLVTNTNNNVTPTQFSEISSKPKEAPMSTLTKVSSISISNLTNPTISTLQTVSSQEQRPAQQTQMSFQQPQQESKPQIQQKLQQEPKPQIQQQPQQESKPQTQQQPQQELKQTQQQSKTPIQVSSQQQSKQQLHTQQAQVQAITPSIEQNVKNEQPLPRKQEPKRHDSQSAESSEEESEENEEDTLSQGSYDSVEQNEDDTHKTADSSLLAAINSQTLQQKDTTTGHSLKTQTEALTKTPSTTPAINSSTPTNPKENSGSSSSSSETKSAITKKDEKTVGTSASGSTSSVATSGSSNTGFGLGFGFGGGTSGTFGFSSSGNTTSNTSSLKDNSFVSKNEGPFGAPNQSRNIFSSDTTTTGSGTGFSTTSLFKSSTPNLFATDKPSSGNLLSGLSLGGDNKSQENKSPAGNPFGFPGNTTGLSNVSTFNAGNSGTGSGGASLLNSTVFQPPSFGSTFGSSGSSGSLNSSSSGAFSLSGISNLFSGGSPANNPFGANFGQPSQIGGSSSVTSLFGATFGQPSTLGNNPLSTFGFSSFSSPNQTQTTSSNTTSPNKPFGSSFMSASTSGGSGMSPFGALAAGAQNFSSNFNTSFKPSDPYWTQPRG